MPARRSGLGRGLDALIPPAGVNSPEAPVRGDGAGPDDEPRSPFRDLPVSSIDPNPYQPRRHFDEAALAELTESVRELGVLQPVLVRPKDGRFELIAGERRLRAARAAGLEFVPALVQALDDAGSLEQAIVENVQRADLSPIEEAAAYQQLVDDFHLTYEQVGRRVGKSKPAVANALRLLNLPPSVQAMIATGELSAGHGKALLGVIEDEERLHRLAERALREGWSVRACEDAVRRLRDEPRRRRRAPAPPTDRGAGVLEVEERLGRHLETRVRVEVTASGRGRMVIDFAGADDLRRLYDVLVQGRPPEG